MCRQTLCVHCALRVYDQSFMGRNQHCKIMSDYSIHIYGLKGERISKCVWVFGD